MILFDSIRNIYLKYPLYLALALGFMFRSVAALYNNTPIAQDDYANIISPALKALQTGADLNTINYRLEILPSIFYYFLNFFQFLGIESYGTLISFGFFILGLFSLFFIWGMFCLGNNFLEVRWRNSLTMLSALYFLMPLIATRPLQGSLALIPLPWAFYYLSKNKICYRDFLLGGFFLGLTTIVRFQITLLVMITAVYLISLVFCRKLPFKSFISFLLGGLLSLAILALCDALFNRVPLSTLYYYLNYNFFNNVMRDGYTNQPWYTYILLLFTLFIPPFSIILIRPFINALSKAKLISLNLVIFVLLHSLIGNKLGRFMIPMLPLFFLLTFIGLQKVAKHKIYYQSYRIFWFINLLLLLPVIFTKSQSNIIDAAIYLQRSEKAIYLKNILSWKQGYLGYEKPVPHNINRIEDLIARIYDDKSEEVYLLNFLSLNANERNILQRDSVFCRKEKQFSPSLLEKVVIWGNPAMNGRRRSTFLYLCKLVN